MNAPPQFPWARQSAGVAPQRLPGSVRRTTSIDSHWPQGFGEPWEMTGRARDIVTPLDGGSPREVAMAGFVITTSPKREILRIATSPRHPREQDLVGVRAGGASREALKVILGEARGTPLFQLLDDFAGASLVAGWIWSQWLDDWRDQAERLKAETNAGRVGSMENVCTGFATGASSLQSDGRPTTTGESNDVGPLEDPQDLQGWHEMPRQEGPQMRRARRIDLTRDGDLLRVDSGFQDSGSNPRGGRSAIHEYRVHAEIDAASLRLVSIQALPLILPFQECPGASVKIGRLVGVPVGELREAVVATLPGTLGCTHLNDVLRALADVPAMARHLPWAGAARCG